MLARICVAILLATIPVARAQVSTGASTASQTQSTSAAPRAERRLPPDSVTHHSINVGGRTLRFTATAGSLRVVRADGTPQADLAYIAYQLDGADAAKRPVTFAMNGGPGNASALLHFGALGPWRLPLEAAARAPSAPPVLQDNAETWLDFTDLVFLDPAGTGFSRLASDTEELRKAVWSVNGDINVLADAMRLWLENAQRLSSPKYIAGESYSGFRGPRLVRALAADQGVGVNGLILVSPALDMATVGAFDPLSFAVRLPSMAAAAHDLSPDQLGDVEAYASGDYLLDLMRGLRDSAAVARVSARVAEITGIDPAIVRRRFGRVPNALFLRERDIAGQRIGSAYDPTLSVADPFPEYLFSNAPDPILAGYGPVFASAMVDLVTRRLNWHPDGTYQLANTRVLREWDWGRGGPEAISALRTDLAIDPGFRVLIGHGIYDLVTPYLMTKFQLAQVPDYGPANRVRLTLHKGGHMFYTNDAGRIALHAEAKALVTGE